MLLHPTTVGRGELLAARLRPDRSVAPLAQGRIATAPAGRDGGRLGADVWN